MEALANVRSLIKMTPKDKLLQDAYEAGYTYERDYHGCAQALVGSLHEVLGIHDAGIFQAASGLGGGVGLSCEGVCGGITGGVMILSQLYGRSRDRIDDKENRRMVAYGLASALLEKFKARYGSIICKDVQKLLFGRSFDLRIPSEFTALIEAGGHSTICPQVVGTAARMTLEVILDHEERTE